MEVKYDQVFAVGGDMNDVNLLSRYYEVYLSRVRGNSASTVNHYQGALRTISKYLVEHGKIKESIFEVSEIADLEMLRAYLCAQPDFVEKDERGNRMYTAGLNNYIRFAKGEEFAELGSFETKMDIVVALPNKKLVTIENWRRNGIIAKQSIEMAKYKCEVDPRHETFIAASSGKQYMEGHHAIPIKQQGHFDVSLDVYANVVCLCPVCHRLLHYGIDAEKKSALNRIYHERADRLANSGIKLSQNEFLEVATK